MGYSTKRKRGRPKIKREPFDYGNERAQARAALFRRFHGDSSKGFEMTSAGRLMLVGAFDGMSEPPETILSALLAYSDGYRGYYQGGAKIAAYERRDRGHDSSWEDRKGERFDAMDARLREAGHHARLAVHAVSVDAHWFPDEDCDWAGRIIEARLWKDQSLAYDSDWAMLDMLRRGAEALVGRAMRRAA
jgi:hypothetical protein